MPGAHHDECLDDLAALGVGFADHCDLGDRRMLDDRALNFRGADLIAGGLDDVVVAADEDEMSARVLTHHVARQIPPILEGGRFGTPVAAEEEEW